MVSPIARSSSFVVEVVAVFCALESIFEPFVQFQGSSANFSCIGVSREFQKTIYGPFACQC